MVESLIALDLFFIPSYLMTVLFYRYPTAKILVFHQTCKQINIFNNKKNALTITDSTFQLLIIS